MRDLVVALSVTCLGVGAIGIEPAQADHQPAFVVPGRANVPVPINGFNAAWGVVNGDIGLYRPGAVPVTVIPSPYVPPLEPDPPVHYRPARPYFPTMGRAPSVGRLEVDSDKPTSPPKSYNRSWSAQSPKVPATITAPSDPMIISPQVNFGEPYDGGGVNPMPPRPRPHPTRFRR